MGKSVHLRNLERLVLLISIILPISPCNISGQVKTWEGMIDIPTYPWEDDVNPKFWAMESGAKGATTVKASLTYPYNMQDHLSRKFATVTYKALFLENEYLKITCLPELGGRLHSVYDKTTGQEVFHRNDVIKPSMIAMRGAFISGGAEWNAGPQVHTVTILSPVDVITGVNPDGSAFLEVSNLEKSLRTRWTVRVTLHPGSSVLDEEIRIYNPVEAMSPYYFWNCTAFPQLPGTRFIYPMSLGTDHFGVRFFNWPVHKGKDLSWAKNYEDASSIFAVDCAYDFFGAYDVDIDRGVIQVADHNEHSGKKAWTWGQGEYGRVSMKNLGDNNPEYIEVQSGPLQTQSDYGLLAPGSSLSWKEYWYPVHGLGNGFEYATKDVAIQTDHERGSITLRMIATCKIEKAWCLLLDDDNELQRRQVDLSPAEASFMTFDKKNRDTVTVLIKTSKGKELAKFKSPLPLPEITPPEQPVYRTKKDDELTTEECYLKAQKFDRALNRPEARNYYHLALAKDTLHLASLRDLAILDFEAARYYEAEKRLVKALNQIPNDDGLAWYFLGLCHLRNNDTEGARKCGFKASRCQGTVSRGYDLVGRTFALDGDNSKALDYFLKAYNTNAYDPMIFNHVILSLYAMGDMEKSKQMASERIAEYPTELVPRFTTGIIDGTIEETARNVKDFVGEDDFEILEASIAFSDLTLLDEAIMILEAGCINNVPENKQNHLVQYWLGYLYSAKENKIKEMYYLERASKNYQDFILASRPETEKVLLHAISVNPGDAIALYQLGNMYANFGRLAESEKLWSKASEYDPSMSIIWRNLGLYYWVEKNDHNKSISCYENAIRERPMDQTLYRDLAKVLDDNNQRKDAITLLKDMPYTGTKRSDIIIDLAQYLLNERRYDECIELLISVPYFVNWEGSSITWDIFNAANLQKGILLYNNKKYREALTCFEKGLTFPENLGVGRSSRTEEAMTWFWKGKALLYMGKDKQALQAFKTGSLLPRGSEVQNHYIDMCGSLCK
ncbi:MAG: DUF5107 domain-containing protein [Bacteroidales bacterium]|nr:DUF5107 domain-containing protein [Bacteroidales bacterium]